MSRKPATTAALLLIAGLLALPAAAQRVRAVQQFPDFSRILVIAAHPDDELLVAPFLGGRCVSGNSKCTLLLMTRGESGSCALADGCGADLGSVRASEVAQSAALLHTGLEIWNLPDVMADVRAQWDARSGSHAALLSRMRQAVSNAAPTMIITFDPAHGSTCHPAHVTTATLVKEALAGTADENRTYFIETRVQFEGNALLLSRGLQFASSIVVLDTTTTWHYMLDAGRLHASQFTPPQIDSLADPGQFRSIVLLPANRAQSARYTFTCP